jgi:ParB-like chromosome segregation protein Spo0J
VPVLTDGEGTILAGHARVLAAGALDMAEVPTIDLSYLTERQRRVCDR